MKNLFEVFHKRRNIYIVLAIVAIALMFSGVLYFYNPLATILNQLFTVETSLEPAEIVLLDDLGGELNEAVKLFEQGFANKILITANLPERYKDESLLLSEHQMIHKELRDKGIPIDAINCLKEETSNRLEQQRLIRDWFHKNEITSYIIQPLRYQTRLEQSIHQSTFPDGDVKLVMHPTKGNFLLRKEIVGYQNVFIYFLYWNLFYAPQIIEDSVIEQSSFHLFTLSTQ